MHERFTLRPYQEEASGRGVAYLEESHGRHGIIVAPTGAGKSLILAEITSRLNGEALVFQPTKELLEQNLAKMRSYGFDPAVYSASMGRREVGQITMATIGSVKSNPEAFSHFPYILIDECHLVPYKNDGSMFMQFIAKLQKPRILGLTATPFRLASNSFGSSLRFLTRTRPRLFTDVVHVTQIPDLYAAGYLAPVEYKEVNAGIREDRLRLNSTGADYTDESVRKHFAELNFADQIARCALRLDELGRTGSIIFTRFIEEAEYVASKVPRCEMVSGETPAYERAQLIEGFRNGDIRHLVNVNVLAVGFDYPALANVILARPSNSLAFYYQAVGRGIRPHPAKRETFVIDMVGLVKKFGKIEDMVVADRGNGKWQFESNGRALTNVSMCGDPKQQRRAKFFANRRK